MFLWFMFLAISSSSCCDLRPVQRLNVASVTSTQVRVSWSAPEDLECVRAYKICAAARDKDADQSCVRVRNPHIGGYVITSLLPCRDYNVSIAALGEEEPQSAVASLMATTGPDPAVDLVVARRGDSASITASWRYDTKHGGGCAKEFKLTWCSGKGKALACNVARMPVMTSTTYSQDLLHVHFCSEYDVTLVVLADKRRGSDPLKATIPELPIEGPQNLTVAHYTSTSIDVRWDLPKNQLTCKYHVFIDVAYKDESSHKFVETIFDSGMASYVINATTPCKAYTITVGFGTAMERKNASVVAYTLPKGNEIFSNASIRHQTSCCVNVSWTTLLDSSECVTSYAVCWGKDNSTDVCRDTTADNFEITGLDPDTNYTVSVEARLGNGASLQSLILAAATTSGATGLFADSITKFLVILSLLKYIIKEHSYEDFSLEQLSFP